MTLLTTAVRSGRGSIQILNSRECLPHIVELTAFENEHFGDGLTWSVEQAVRWANSSVALHAAVIQDGVEPKILGSMSVLLVHASSIQRLIEGSMVEAELEPWTEGSRRPPIIYFASVIARTKETLSPLYESLENDIFMLLQREKLQAEEGLAIASGEAGRRHLERNGFRPLGESRYLDRYPFMRITARQARTSFWRRILSEPIAPISLAPTLAFSAGSPLPA